MGCRIASNARDSNQDPEVEQDTGTSGNPARRKKPENFSSLQRNMDKTNSSRESAVLRARARAPPRPRRSRASRTRLARSTEKKSSRLGADLNFTQTKVVAKGSFGVVFKGERARAPPRTRFPHMLIRFTPPPSSAIIPETGEKVGIKKVLQDPRYKNRELQILRLLKHQNIVHLNTFFYTKEKEDVYLNLVMEYIPQTIHHCLKRHMSESKSVPPMITKAYVYQIFRALQYVHSLGVCHRDIKPHNLLVNSQTHVCKICDFGSAKILEKGQRNVAYICSRYYRAPELILDAKEYTTAIDVWSAGCVMAEFFLGEPIFLGRSKADQLTEIMKILGTPSASDILVMNPNHPGGALPPHKGRPWARFWGKRASKDAIALMSQLLCYRPTVRLTATQTMQHPFFDDLRKPGATMPGGKPLPPLFDK